MPVSPAVGVRKRPIPHLRWVLAGVLTAVSVINYIDRQTLSILARTIQDDLRISDHEYSLIVQAFLLTYLVMHVLSGRVVDRAGPRIAETLFICWWSVANICTAFATGFWPLAFNRMMLGIGEPGHYSASGKAVSEWFPAKEKGVAVGMYVMGGTVGAAFAAPLLAWLATSFGWRVVFAITGALGFIPAAIWYLLYRHPADHGRLSGDERQMLAQAGLLAERTERPKALSLGEVLRLKGVWPVMAARLITDPLWLFYLFWFPKYLQDIRGFSLQQLGFFAWTLYATADLGALSGGWLSGLLVRRGMAAPKARLAVLGAAAAILAGSFVLPLLPGKFAALAAASVFTFAEMAWMTNCVALPLDLVPPETAGSVQGMIGAAGSLGGLLSTSVVGWMVTHVSYGPVFTAMSFLHAAAVLILFLTLRGGFASYGRK